MKSRGEESTFKIEKKQNQGQKIGMAWLFVKRNKEKRKKNSAKFCNIFLYEV